MREYAIAIAPYACWSIPIFRYTSKVSRQVLRFFKHCFHKPASQVLYEAQLRPLLLAYL